MEYLTTTMTTLLAATVGVVARIDAVPRVTSTAATTTETVATTSRGSLRTFF